VGDGAGEGNGAAMESSFLRGAFALNILGGDIPSGAVTGEGA
jgi:hypothetical protein